ncbi:MAG: DNA polymerase III subunit gamma/tau [Raoultibacter sp.]
MSEALYRTYRPQTFADVVGQDHIERTIRNAIEQDKVSHAYLFCGPRGTGKTTTARLLAKALLCENGPTPDPDGTCAACHEIAEGGHPDVYELDAASRTGVENVREEIIGRVQFSPTRGRYKVYIIDEVHMLSTAAFNALLKTLEEPPSHVVFILCTTDPQKVPETIHSRCQRFDFRRIAADAIVSRLGAICVSEEVEFEGEALDLIAHRAEGGMRNALTALEQVIAFGGGKVTLANAESMLGSLDCDDMAEIVMHIGQRDAAACFAWTANYIETGADLAHFTRDLSEHVRNMYVLSLVGDDVVLEVSEATRREMVRELELFGPERLANLLGVLGDLQADLRQSTNTRLSFEIALTRMVRPDSDVTLSALAERIEALEAGHSAVAQVVSVASAKDVPVVAGQGDVPVAAVAARGEVLAATSRGEVPVAVAGAGDARPAAAVEHRAGARTADELAGDRAGAGAAASAAPSSAGDAQVDGSAGNVAASLKNPAALQRIWQSALTELKKTKPAYGVMFLNTKVTFDEASQGIVVAFSAENSFAFLTVKKPEIVDELKRTLTHAAGGSVAFRFVQDGQPATAAAASATAPATAATAPAAPAAAVVAPAAPAATPVAVANQTASTAKTVAVAQNTEQPPVSEEDFDRVPLDLYDESVAPTPEPKLSAAPADASTVPAAGSTDQEEDIAALLTASFGAGVVFEEVDEDR